MCSKCWLRFRTLVLSETGFEYAAPKVTAGGNMKAIVLETLGPLETSPFKLREYDTPVPSPHQVVIGVTACGVCRSNLHMIEGDWRSRGIPSKLPIIPGHEVVGVIADLGAQVEGFHVGDRVGVQPLWWSCGRCSYCLAGREQLCAKREITGETVDGGYAEYMLASSEHLYLVPDGLSDAEAAPLFCPGVTAYGAVAKAELSPSKEVANFGIGGVGHLVIQMALLAGAEVTAVARSRPFNSTQVITEAGTTGNATQAITVSPTFVSENVAGVPTLTTESVLAGTTNVCAAGTPALSCPTALSSTASVVIGETTLTEVTFTNVDPPATVAPVTVSIPGDSNLGSTTAANQSIANVVANSAAVVANAQSVAAVNSAAVVSTPKLTASQRQALLRHDKALLKRDNAKIKAAVAKVGNTKGSAHRAALKRLAALRAAERALKHAISKL